MRAWGRVAIPVVAALLGLAFVIGTILAGRKVEQDPRFCASSCHHEMKPGSLAAPNEWHTQGHAGVSCQGCHATSLTTGLRLLWESSMKSAPTAHGKATAEACTDCHEKKPAEWRLISQTTGHREHREAKNVDCLSCHAGGVHGSEVPEKPCLGCHEDQRLHKATTIGAETCLSCHSYGVTAKNSTPSPAACEKCHASPAALLASAGGAPVPPMPSVNEHVLHGGVPCQLCHNAHGIKPKPPAAGQPVCARCHQLTTTTTPQPGMAPSTGHDGKCEGCHKPHAPKGSAISNCVSCHEKNAKGILPDGETALTAALKHKSCATCHVPHTWKADGGGCMQCHNDETRLFRTRSPPEHKACTDCHDVHGAPATGAVCLECHSDTKGKHVALAPERHKDCTSCHNPHAPKPEDTRGACAKCHTSEVALVSAGPQGHVSGSCLGCHKPHESPMPASDVCAKCHGQRAIAVQKAEPAKHRECLSCHEPHEFRATDVVATCSKCHENLFNATARGVASIPHDTECRSCHAFHGEPGVPRAACLQCHKKVSAEFHATNEKHADCSSCHQPHTPASAAPAQCRTCHADKAAIAAKWPPASAHAQECNICHQEHDVGKERACSDCHASEATSAMGGKHKCQQCHAPHAAPPGQGAAWWQRCSTCHASQVETAKERGPVHAECKNCHQPHQFAEPTCASCHKDMSAKGLHAVPQHVASCKTCHDPHVKSLPKREQCLTCHTNKQDHEPNAPSCYTCHLFK